MATIEDLGTALRKRFPEDCLMLAHVPTEDRSDRRREEYVHFRASDVVWIETTGPRQLRFHLMGGGIVTFRGELARALKFFQEMGFPFVRTHRQVLVRLDRVTGIAQA